MPLPINQQPAEAPPTSNFRVQKFVKSHEYSDFLNRGGDASSNSPIQEVLKMIRDHSFSTLVVFAASRPTEQEVRAARDFPDALVQAPGGEGSRLAQATAAPGIVHREKS